MNIGEERCQEPQGYLFFRERDYPPVPGSRDKTGMHREGPLVIRRMFLKGRTIWEQARKSRGFGTVAVFLFVGIASTLVDISLLWLLTAYFGVWYLLSATISYCCGIVISYGLNKNLTFHDRSRSYVSQFSWFAIVSVLCLAVTLCIIWGVVELLSINYLIAKIGAASCAFFLNYYGQSRITFPVRVTG